MKNKVSARTMALRWSRKSLRQILVAVGAVLIVPIALADDGQVCKATIAALMNRDPSIIDSQSAGGKVLLSYQRSDGDTFAYKCRVDGSRVFWGNADGRWRDHSMDSTITYAQSGNRITINEKGPDGSSIQKTFEIAPTE